LEGFLSIAVVPGGDDPTVPQTESPRDLGVHAHATGTSSGSDQYERDNPIACVEELLELGTKFVPRLIDLPHGALDTSCPRYSFGSISRLESSHSTSDAYSSDSTDLSRRLKAS
jgi:hypothetical protein